jgi:hypothetical protein
MSSASSPRAWQRSISGTATPWILALRKHIHECHGELEHVLELGGRRTRLLTSGRDLHIATLGTH